MKISWYGMTPYLATATVIDGRNESRFFFGRRPDIALRKAESFFREKFGKNGVGCLWIRIEGEQSLFFVPETVTKSNKSVKAALVSVGSEKGPVHSNTGRKSTAVDCADLFMGGDF